MTYFVGSDRFYIKKVEKPGPGTYHNKHKFVKERTLTPIINEYSPHLTPDELFQELDHFRNKSMMDINNRIYLSSGNLNEGGKGVPTTSLRKSTQNNSFFNDSLKQYIKEKEEGKGGEDGADINTPDKADKEGAEFGGESISTIKVTPKRDKMKVQNKLDSTGKNKKCRELNKTFADIVNERQLQISKMQDENILKIMKLRQHVDMHKTIQINIDGAGVAESNTLLINDTLIHSRSSTIKSVGPGRYNVQEEEKKSYNIMGTELYKDLYKITHPAKEAAPEQKKKAIKRKINSHYHNSSQHTRQSVSPLRESPYTYKKGREETPEKTTNQTKNYLNLNKKLVHRVPIRPKSALGSGKKKKDSKSHNYQIPKTPVRIFEVGEIGHLPHTSPPKKIIGGNSDISTQRLYESNPAVNSEKIKRGAKTSRDPPPTVYSNFRRVSSYARKFLDKRKKIYEDEVDEKPKNMNMNMQREKGMLRIDARKMGIFGARKTQMQTKPKTRPLTEQPSPEARMNQSVRQVSINIQQK